MTDRTILCGHGVEPLDWDGRMLGMRCGCLAMEPVQGESLASRRNLGAYDLISAHVPIEREDLRAALTAAGGMEIGTEQTLVYQGPPGGEGGQAQVTFHDRWDGDEFLELAPVLRCSRFYLDPWIPDDRAEALWRASIRNHCRGRAGELAVAHADDRPAGLVALTAPNPGERSLFIVGVLPEYQGRGVGLSLMHAVVERHAGKRSLTVECLSGNRPALTLYHKAGFRVNKETAIIHFWPGRLGKGRP